MASAQLYWTYIWLILHPIYGIYIIKLWIHPVVKSNATFRWRSSSNYVIHCNMLKSYHFTIIYTCDTICSGTSTRGLLERRLRKKYSHSTVGQQCATSLRQNSATVFQTKCITLSYFLKTVNCFHSGLHGRLRSISKIIICYYILIINSIFIKWSDETYEIEWRNNNPIQITRVLGQSSL